MAIFEQPRLFNRGIVWNTRRRVTFHKRAFQEANREIASHSNRRRYWIYFFQLNFRSFFSLLFFIINELND